MKTCSICDKGSLLFGHYTKLRGKYNPSLNKIRKQPNLQWLTIASDTTKKKYKALAGQRVKACTKCIKAFSKQT